MRFKSIDFNDLVSYYPTVVTDGIWAVGQTKDSEEYDIYYVDEETRRYEYLASDTVNTGSQVIRMIFEKVGLC